MKSAAPFEIGGFNLDNILNLMAGDTQGNVDFGAIGIEVAQNLANVIDMNEVGNMATALGMMMSGIGVATEMQRQNSENRNAPNKDQNTIINSGVAALLQQVLSNSQESADTIPGQGSENIFNAIGSNNLNAAQLVNLVAGGQGGNLDMQGIVNAFGNVMGSGQDTRNPGGKRETQQHKPIAGTSVLKNNIANSETGPADTAESIAAGRKAQNAQNHLPVENKNENTATAADTGVRKIASLMDDLVNGDDTSGMAACLSPLDGVKRPAAKSGHCHQDTECRPGWGGWNCNMCLNDAACDALNPTGEGGRCYNGSELITNVVASVLSEVEGPVDIKCHDDGFSNCYIREFMISKTLAAIIGDDAINMKCTVVQGPDLVSLKSLGVNIGSSSQLSGISSNAQKIANSHDINAKSVQVLKNISGVVKPGEILAILGASGAGKSTLLDILSRREKCGVVTGKVQINDKDIISGITTEEFHRMSGYVDQQDLHVATATVYETVLTSALLRLPQAMSRAAKEERVRDVLQELGLWTVRDSKIGKIGARGISGGEMRRVSIACELVTSPSIIFLDEPTSGLDAYNAFVVMDTLSKLARRYGRTVICTIHQPRTDIFSMFDQLIVLAAGQMCYSGPAEDIANYLGTIGHPVPDGYNIADFSIDLVQQATVTSAKELAGSPKPITDNDTRVSEKSQTLSLEKSDDIQPSDDEWDPLLGTSSVSLTATKYDNTKPEVTRQKGSQFIVYNAHVSLNKILDSFQASDQCKRITEQLDNITGPEWTASPFDKVSSIGGVPHMRPVTPLQQVVVIFLNIYDLLTLLYNRLRGRRVGTSFKDELRPPVFEQFKILSARIFRHLYRDPTLMLANYAMSVFIGLMCGVLFYQLDSSVQGVQNRLGLIMFVLAFYGFGATTSLLVFAEERLLYLRERANAYYDPMAYFLAKVTFDLIPLRVVPPMLLTLIMYPMTGLAATWHQFIKFFSTLVLFNLTTASQMFFIGLLAEQLVVSNFLASLVLLFSLLFGGLILNKESIPSILQPLFGTSSFNLAYEALAINELRYAHIEEVRFGLEIEVPTAALISSFGFNLQAFWPDITFMFIVLAVSLGMSLLWLTFVIKERR
ncbi:(ABC) transporter [Coemansia sp. RSA 1722]|nr:(ABC) transporter [Coemansia sp. RSA 1722]